MDACPGLGRRGKAPAFTLGTETRRRVRDRRRPARRRRAPTVKIHAKIRLIVILAMVVTHQFELLVGVEFLPCNHGWLRRQSGNIVLHLLGKHGCRCVLRKRRTKKPDERRAGPASFSLDIRPSTQEYRGCKWLDDTQCLEPGAFNHRQRCRDCRPFWSVVRKRSGLDDSSTRPVGLLDIGPHGHRAAAAS
jgi:hypothetical protein